MFNGIVEMIVKKSNRYVVVMPAETWIIKIDYVQPTSFNDDVGRMQGGMNDAVSMRVFTKLKEKVINIQP